MRLAAKAFSVAGAVTLAVGLGFGVQASSAAPAGTPSAIATPAASGQAGIAAAGASASFYPDGDKLVVCDNAEDGAGAFGELYWNGVTGRSNRADGSGDCSTATGNIAEGTTVYVRACNVKAGVISGCGAWIETKA